MKKPVEQEILDTVKAEPRDKEINLKVYPPSGEPHANQKKILMESARFKVVVCGRRFGKTTFAINSMFLEALMNENGTYWYVAPTYRQAKQIAWRMLFDLYRHNEPKLFYKRPNESELKMVLHNGSYLELKGADNEDSLRGVGLDGVILDEYSMMKPNVWEEIIEPTLLDKQGWAIFIGTPKGYDHFYELYEKANKTPGWKNFHFTSYDNPYIKKQEIDKKRASVQEDYFAQEYLAEFRRFTGLVYKGFSRDTHVVEPFQIPADWPKWRTIDAGFTNPFVCLWITEDPSTNTFYIYDEHYLAQQTIRFHGEIINGRSIGQYFRATYIDPSARQQMQDLAEMGIYCTQAENTVTGGGRGGSYQSGIAKVSELLKVNPTTEKPRIYIFNHCKNLVKEFEVYRWEENKHGHTKREIPHKENDHAMDALRYFVNSYFNLQKPKPYKAKAEPYKPTNSFTGY